MNLQDAIKNQEKFKKEIENWLKKNFNETKASIKTIDCEHDEYINLQKIKLEKKAKDATKNVEEIIKSFFIMQSIQSKKRTKYYAYWIENSQEVVIESYKK